MLLAPFKASEEELQLANRLLGIANCEAAGALNSQAAIDIFGRSGLSFELLRDIWNMADKHGTGDLSKEELVIAIRLMGWVQSGEALNDSLLTKFGPLPTLKGITDIVHQPSVYQPSRQPTPTIQTPQFPVVTTIEIRNFKSTFMRLGPVNGLLDGDKVMDAFMSSNLSYGHIWKIKKLVDKSGRDALDFREFAIGMYLIHALQSCLICDVPSTIPQDLSDQFANLQAPEGDQSPPILHHLSPSSSQESTLRSYVSTPAPHERNHSPLPPLPQHDTWDISPEEKRDSDSHFHKLDFERKGYLETGTAAKFMITYQLPEADLGQIWMLADINKDNKLTSDEFAIVMHLIKQRQAGVPVPATLPPSLFPPSLKSAASSPSLSPTQRSKPPPPPPKKDRLSVIGLNGLARSESSSSGITSPTGNSKYSSPLSPPLSPTVKRTRASMSGPPMSFLTNVKSPPRPPPLTDLSPFEDPSAEINSTAPSHHHSPSPDPRPPESSSSEALEELFKKETARLSKQVETLLSQLTEQNKHRDSNEALRAENEALKTQMQDMERTVSEVLSANDSLGTQSQDRYNEQIARLNAELSAKESQCENSERMIAMLNQDQQELRASLRDVQAAATKSHNEAEAFQHTINTQTEEIKELRARVSDMSNAMSEPSSTTNNRELRVLLRDATKENESLKVQLRDLKKSMEEFLLSSRSPTQVEELKRENRRLKEHVHELQEIAATVHSSSANGRLPQNNSASRGSETLARENEQLKQQLRDGQRALADIRSSNETRIVEMQQKVDNLTHENNRLKIEASRSSQPQEDNSIPPPSYDDSFVIPP